MLLCFIRTDAVCCIGPRASPGVLSRVTVKKNWSAFLNGVVVDMDLLPVLGQEHHDATMRTDPNGLTQVLSRPGLRMSC